MPRLIKNEQEPRGKFSDWTHPNPRRNTSKDFFESLLSGNIVEIHFRYISGFISTLFPLPLNLDRHAEIKRKHLSTLFPVEDVPIH